MVASGAGRRCSTIRARTVAAACAVVALASSLGVVLVLTLLQHAFLRNIDNAAKVRAADVAELVRADELPAELAVKVADENVVQVVGQDGTVVAASANVQGIGPISELRPPPERTEVTASAHISLAEAPEDRFRIVALGVMSPSGPMTVYVAASLEPVAESVATVRKIMLVGLPCLLLLVAVTTWWMVGRALRPVDAIRQEVDDISAGRLDRRVPEPPNDDEIGRLARGMNRMLDRLESFSDRQRRFVADASHELQSPLASSLALLEVAQAHPDATDWSDTADELVADNRRMARLVQNLLFLARADDDTLGGTRVPIDLDDVVLAEIARLAPRAAIELDGSAVQPMEVRGDPDQLARAARNLLENAARYAATRVRVELHGCEGSAELVVSDDGPGIAPPDRERVFERFTRLDDSRSRATGGVGLGLAITREIVQSHGGTIVAEEGPGAGCRFLVRLPLDPGDRASGAPDPGRWDQAVERRASTGSSAAARSDG